MSKNEYKQLGYTEQLKLFHDRGIIFDYSFEELDQNNQNYQKNLQAISTLGYYQLKDYAYPYLKNGKYVNLSFSKLVARYYKDKRLRNAVEHAIEDIEASLNTRIAFLLGEKYGPLGYLEFNKWCQTEGKNKHLKSKKIDKYFIAKEQNEFLRKIQGKAKKSASKDVKKFNENNKFDVYVPIWLIMNELTLGDSIRIVKLMSRCNKLEIANNFGCTIDELISWLDCINLVRNICCHNGNLVDLKLKTSPKVPDELKQYLITAGNEGHEIDGVVYTKKLAIIICIILKLMSSVNVRYRFGNLVNSISYLVDETNTPESYGFRNKKAIHQVFIGRNSGSGGNYKKVKMKHIIKYIDNQTTSKELEKLTEVIEEKLKSMS